MHQVFLTLIIAESIGTGMFFIWSRLMWRGCLPCGYDFLHPFGSQVTVCAAICIQKNPAWFLIVDGFVLTLIVYLIAILISSFWVRSNRVQEDPP